MTTKILDVALGNRLITSTYRDDKVHDVVDGWNWNANIFEIYDEIRDWRTVDQRNVLRYAYDYFNKDAMIDELASFLTGSGVKDD
jgi:hypothetical protein